MTFKINSTLAALALSVSSFALPAFADNPLLDSDFWKEADLAKVEAAIAAGADPVEKGEGNYTPFVRAIRGGATIDILDYLVSKGADVNRATHDNRSTFFYVARYGNMEVIKHVIGLGGDIHAISPSGRNAIGYAGFGQADKEVFKFLIDEGLDPNLADPSSGRTAFLAAAYYNKNFDVVEFLAGVSDTSARTTDGSDAFMLAASRNKNLDVVKAMYEISKDPKAKTTDHGEDALLLAAYRNENLETFAFLKEKGFKTDAKTSEGRSGLSVAAYRNKGDVVQMFLDAGNDVNGTDDNGKTPLYYAATRNSPEVFAQLIAAGADVNAVAKDGSTPLLAAADRDRKGAEDIIASLIAAGADASVADEDGQTVLIASARTGHSLATLKSFVDGGANVNAVDGDKMSALMYAALKGDDPEVITFLLASGADAKLGDDFDDTAADFAAENPALKGSDVVATLAALLK